MAEDPKPPVSRRSLRSAATRALLLVALLTIAFFIVRSTSLAQYLDSQQLAGVLETLRSTVWAAPVLLVLYVVLSPLGAPISPLIFAGGAVFGLAGGWLLNVVGALLGAAATFAIGQRMGRDLVVHLVSARNLERAEKILVQHGFWAIVRVRFFPIPFALINYGAALAGVRLPTFLAATAVGLAPSLFIYTTLSYALVNATSGNRANVIVLGVLSLAALLGMTFLPGLLRPRQNQDTL